MTLSLESFRDEINLRACDDYNLESNLRKASVDKLERDIPELDKYEKYDSWYGDDKSDLEPDHILDEDEYLAEKGIDL